MRVTLEETPLGIAYNRKGGGVKYLGEALQNFYKTKKQESGFKNCVFGFVCVCVCVCVSV